MAKRTRPVPQAPAPKAGAAGLRVHPDFAADAAEKRRRRAMQAETETVEVDALDTVETTREPMARGTVARGRCIDAPERNAQKVVRSAPDGRDFHVPLARRYMPGEEISLPESELARLRELGFIVDPNKIVPAPLGATAIQQDKKP
jgi:hypothetical protein